MATVSFHSIEKSFGTTKVIQGISFDIKEGEFMVLVGPSGCGKSTLLRMLAGLEEITGGTIAIDDKVVNDVESKDRDIAMVFQSYALYPHMTVADNMAFSLKLRKADPKMIAERVDKASKILNLDPYLHRFPRELSGGQRQRVAMGRAIVRDPKVFLFDEPLSNLDAKLRVAMRAEIKALHQRLQTTTVYVTHDQVEAMTMGDRVAVMSMGVLQQIDTPQRLYDEPANLFVAGFIGTPPMNLFDGTVHATAGDVSITIGSTTLPVGAACVQRYGRVRSLDGQSVVVGIRAEDVHPALTRTDLPTLDARIELVEALGSGLMAYLRIDATQVRPVGVDEEDLPKDGEGVAGIRPNLIAHFPPRLDLRIAETIPIAIDTAGLHFFDKETGAALS